MSSRRGDEQFQPIAALMAAIFPGLGYLYFGETKRAILVCAGIMGLFLAALLVGGIDVIDRKEDRWWFLLQAGVGPTALVVDQVHQTHFKFDIGRGIHVSGRPNPLENPKQQPAPNRKSVGRVNEAGTLMASLAGMLNIIAFIDCLWHVPRRPQRRTSDPVSLRIGAPGASGGA